MKRIILFFACVAMVIGLSACGGKGNSGSKDSGNGYKEPFGFLEAKERGGSALNAEDVSLSSPEYNKMFKKEETAKQTEILDQMMAGSNKKVAIICSKTFYSNGWVSLRFGELSVDNGAKLNILGSGAIAFLPLFFNLKEFPEAGYPFEEYYIILDKNGNVARIQPKRDSYSWLLERGQVKSRIRTHVLNSGQSWSGWVEVPKDVEEYRRKFWEEGGTTETDYYAPDTFKYDQRLGY